MRFKKLKPVVVILLVWLGLYVVTYVVLSAYGDWYWSQTGELRYNSGFAVTDVGRWQPAWAKWEPFRDVYGTDGSRGNPQGYFFAPLICLDRLWFHPDRKVPVGVSPR